jgi:hypothetical protein
MSSTRCDLEVGWRRSAKPGADGEGPRSEERGPSTGQEHAPIGLAAAVPKGSATSTGWSALPGASLFYTLRQYLASLGIDRGAYNGWEGRLMIGAPGRSVIPIPPSPGVMPK